MVRGVPNDPLLIVPAPVEEESAFDEETKEEAGGAAEKALAPTSDADDANCGDEVARTALIVAAAPLAIVAAPFYLGYQAAGSFCADIEPAEPSEIEIVAPAGAKPGMQVSVTLPTGRVIDLVLPPGTAPGMRMQFIVPPAPEAPAEPDVESDGAFDGKADEHDAAVRVQSVMRGRSQRQAGELEKRRSSAALLRSAAPAQQEADEEPAQAGERAPPAFQVLFTITLDKQFVGEFDDERAHLALCVHVAMALGVTSDAVEILLVDARAGSVEVKCCVAAADAPAAEGIASTLNDDSIALVDVARFGRNLVTLVEIVEGGERPAASDATPAAASWPSFSWGSEPAAQTTVDAPASTAPEADPTPRFPESWRVRRVVAPPGMLGVAFERTDAGPRVGGVDPESPLIGEVEVGDVLVGLGDLDCATTDAKQIHERFMMDQGSRELHVRPRATLDSAPPPAAAVESIVDTAPAVQASAPRVAEDASAADPADGGTTAQEVATGVAKGAAVLVLAPLALVAAPFYLGYRAATAPGTAPPPAAEPATEAPAPASADVKAVEFTAHLAAVSVDEFDAGARRAFCHGVATELGVHAGSVTVTRVAAGSVVVEVRVEAEDAARAAAIASALRAPGAAIVDEGRFGPCAIAGVRFSSADAPRLGKSLGEVLYKSPSMRKEKPPREEVDADAPKKFAVPDSMRGFAPAEHVSDKHDPGEIIHYVAFEVTLGMTIDGFDKTARGAFCYFAAAELGLDHDAIVVTSVIPRSRDALEESSSVYVQGEVIVDSMMSAVMVAAALEDPELKLVDETMFGPCSVSNVRMSTKLAPTPSWQCNWSSETQAEPAARDAFADEPEVEAEFESPPSPSSKAEARRLERENELRAERVLAGRSAKAWAEKQLSMTSLEEPETAPEPSRAAPAKGSLLLCGDVDDEPAATAESSSLAQEERYCVAPPGRLGLRFDRAGGDDGHYVQGVDADSALLGSVGVDDVIVSVNGYPTSSLGPGAISTELEELENVERVLVLRAARKGWMRLPDMSFSQPPSADAAGEPEPVAPSAPAEPASSSSAPWLGVYGAGAQDSKPEPTPAAGEPANAGWFDFMESASNEDPKPTPKVEPEPAPAPAADGSQGMSASEIMGVGAAGVAALVVAPLALIAAPVVYGYQAATAPSEPGSDDKKTAPAKSVAPPVATEPLPVPIVYACGRNANGELGLGHKENSLALVPVPCPFRGASRILQVTCGGNHTMVLTSEGEVWACGFNSVGQLGLGQAYGADQVRQRVRLVRAAVIFESRSCSPDSRRLSRMCTSPAIGARRASERGFTTRGCSTRCAESELTSDVPATNRAPRAICGRRVTCTLAVSTARDSWASATRRISGSSRAYPSTTCTRAQKPGSIKSRAAATTRLSKLSIRAAARFTERSLRAGTTATASSASAAATARPS